MPTPARFIQTSTAFSRPIRGWLPKVPDGTASESSVYRVLVARGVIRSGPAMVEDIDEVQRQLGHNSARQGVPVEEDTK